ncbi:MAG: hypothetical protein U5J83_15405 [Bryobacterales bacterium]|nr:hypothetical protein [Bryobacterales bacterium]
MIEAQQDDAALRVATARVLDSVTFHKSTRLRQLLMHLTGEVFAGRGVGLREHEIGVQVFARGDDFDPSEDSIVRASIRQLRAKLLEYYSAEGVADEWQIEIPRGSYVPVFVPRSQAHSPGAAASHSSESGQQAPNGKRRLVRSWLAVAAGALVIAAVAFFAGTRMGSTAGKALPMLAQAGNGSLMEHFLSESEGPVHFVPSDSVVNLVRSLTGKKLTLEGYSSRQFFQPDHPAAAALPRHWDSMVSRELMNIGDASIVLRAAREYPGEVDRFVFRQSRDLNARDLKEGNFVFLGSATANPWLELFNDTLNFRMSTPDESEAGRWLNLTPRAGERRLYPEPPLPAGVAAEPSYAHVAIVPNRSRSGMVLIVGGTLMSDTEAAGEFVLSRGSANTVAAALGADGLESKPYFEVLLETRRAGSTRAVTRVAASRVIANHPSGNRSSTENTERR